MNKQELTTKNEMLLIDTSTPLLFLSRALRQQDNRWQTTHFLLAKVPREKDTWLKEAVDDFYKKFFSVPPQVIAVGEGPGSFTSIRGGFTFTSILAMLWNIPSITFSSYGLLEKIILLQKKQNKKEKSDGVLLLRANRYMFFGREENTVKALPKEKWKSLKTAFLFFAYENQEEIKKEFDLVKFVPFDFKNTDIQNTEQENFFVDDLFCYPEKEQDDFSFVPNYGIELTFKQKGLT